jgi:hypothetical protein
MNWWIMYECAYALCDLSYHIRMDVKYAFKILASLLEF